MEGLVSPAAWPLTRSTGQNLHAFGVYLIVFQHIPYERARDLICDLIGPQVSTATLKAWVDKAAQGLTDFDEQLRALLGG